MVINIFDDIFLFILVEEEKVYYIKKKISEIREPLQAEMRKKGYMKKTKKLKKDSVDVFKFFSDIFRQKKITKSKEKKCVKSLKQDPKKAKQKIKVEIQGKKMKKNLIPVTSLKCPVIYSSYKQ